MKICHACLPLVVLGWICTSLLARDNLANDRSGSFAYVAEPARSPAPRFRKIEDGLPAGISRRGLIAGIDPKGALAWRFGWFTYGENHSRSVAVALKGESCTDLFVDVNRDKRFSLDERFETCPEDAERWRVVIGAEFPTVSNQYDQVARSILVRPAGEKGLVEIATQGVMEGSVAVNGKEMRAVRVDRNSNGCWSDSQDRILLDTNGDGAADPIGERFACDTICRIDGKRFALQSDMRGERLELVEFSGSGTVLAQLRMWSDSAVISDVSGMMVSRAGVRVPIRSLDQRIECPVGHYRIETLTLKVADGEVNYSFRFSSRNTLEHDINVRTGQSTEVDLLGDLTLTSKQSTVIYADGATLDITPQLVTTSGLYLCDSKVGPGIPTLDNRLLVESVFEGQIINNSSSGFS